MSRGRLVMHIGADDIVRIPATWPDKRCSEDGHDRQQAVDRFAEKLGYDYAYLEEDDDEND